MGNLTSRWRHSRLLLEREGFGPPFTVRPNIEDPEMLVTVFDGGSLPVLTTHSKDLANMLADAFTSQFQDCQ